MMNSLLFTAIFGVLLFSSCYTYPLAYNIETKEYSQERINHCYSNVYYSRRNRISEIENKNPEFDYKYDSSTGDVYVKSILYTSLHEGEVVPEISVLTSNFEIPVIGNVLTNELVSISCDNNNYSHRYLTVMEFVLTRKVMSEIRTTKYLGFQMKTKNKEELKVEPRIFQLLDLKKIGLPH